MAFTQIGYLGGAGGGPVFEETGNASAGGKKIIMVGQSSPSPGMYAKQAAYAGQLNLPAADYSLGPYVDNQRVGDIPAFKVPTGGVSFSGFDSNVAAMVSGTSIPGGSTTTGSTTTGSTTTSTGSTTTSGGTTTDTGTVTYKAATVGEQISTFLSNYWWVVVILALLLLWNPVIAPALGMKKRRRYYR